MIARAVLLWVSLVIMLFLPLAMAITLAIYSEAIWQQIAAVVAAWLIGWTSCLSIWVAKSQASR